MKLKSTLQALEYLSNHGPTAAGMVGAHLWPTRDGPVVACHGGGDYAAQMMLGRLRVKGLVEVAPGEGSSQWEITRKGRDLLRSQGSL